MSQLYDAVTLCQQETRQLASRLSVMETGFSYICHGGSLVTGAAATGAFGAPLPGPSSLFPRDISTVSELYSVWFSGSAGFPAIASLNDAYGAAWRAGDRQYYSVRLQIINEVDRLAAVRNISMGDATFLLDTERRE
ncbi:hypothetical protein V1509DRAFT_572263 [Lipomyces kononenkoae]